MPPPEPGSQAAGRPCPVCGRPLRTGDGGCRNPLCASASRWFRWSRPIAERGGALALALDKYKYRGDHRWADPFGELLAASLSGPERLIDGFDLVVASPTYVGPGGRNFDHTGAILRAAAARLDGADRARVDLATPPAIVRCGPAPRLAGLGHAVRRRIAEETIRPLLRVPRPRRTAGRRILVVDDVFTDGRTLDEVARALRLQGGAREVCGLSLCRQPWRPPPSDPPEARFPRRAPGPDEPTAPVKP